MGLPVSVIIPSIPSRTPFLRDRCLPSVRENGAAEIIVDDGPGNGSVKRNRGASKATMPYLLFVDDDDILKTGCIQRMLQRLEERLEDAFVYSDLERVITSDAGAVVDRWVYAAGEFSAKRLRAYNYINTVSLVRASAAPKWDETLERFQDWDLWLGLVLSGKTCSYIPEALYEKWKIDAGVTETTKANPYIEMIVAKYRLNL
jgi:glycosyltransferase involved in cell wall biosynthesis